MKSLQVSIHITRDEYLKWYQGAAGTVYAQTTAGKSVRFPARILQPFVTHQGVSGTFNIYFDDNNKFKDIRRIR
ncbi:MAG: DUF2835 domain-containing protein [Pseudomonadales bacterium]|nr:DUF2835 domain-containing protein [Pseudomonadales bacterium]